MHAKCIQNYIVNVMKSPEYAFSFLPGPYDQAPELKMLFSPHFEPPPGAVKYERMTCHSCLNVFVAEKRKSRILGGRRRRVALDAMPGKPSATVCEYLVQWKDLSHAHVSWVPREWLETESSKHQGLWSNLLTGDCWLDPDIRGSHHVRRIAHPDDTG